MVINNVIVDPNSVIIIVVRNNYCKLKCNKHSFKWQFLEMDKALRVAVWQRFQLVILDEKKVFLRQIFVRRLSEVLFYRNVVFTECSGVFSI